MILFEYDKSALQFCRADFNFSFHQLKSFTHALFCAFVSKKQYGELIVVATGNTQCYAYDGRSSVDIFFIVRRCVI